MKLNNKGYMLIEIILASVIAMTIAYFMTDLTLKIKNKNDDLLVKTLVSTDQAIIYNAIMKDLYSGRYVDGVSCDDISGKVVINNTKNIFKYNNFTNIVSEYAMLGNFNCVDKTDYLEITVPLSVKQLPDDDFNVNIKYKK